MNRPIDDKIEKQEEILEFEDDNYEVPPTDIVAFNEQDHVLI